MKAVYKKELKAYFQSIIGVYLLPFLLHLLEFISWRII